MTGEPKGVVERTKDITNMKKTYIKPSTTAIDVRVTNMLAASGNRKINETPAQSMGSSGINGDGNGDVYSREVIQTTNAWEEW